MMVNQNVLRFKVSMKYPFRMDVSNSIQYLLQDNFDLLLVYLVIFAVYVLLEIVIVIIEHYFEQLIFGFVQDVDEWHDVGVLFECFE